MTLRPTRFFSFCLPAPLVLAACFFSSAPAPAAQAQKSPSVAPESPYGGLTVEDILARVNDQIISKSDYDRAMKDADDEARQHGASMQQIAEGHRDLLRNLIDQQLWLSKAKELGITGDTEVVKQLDEIRKKYNLATMEDLEKAARDQGISYEDFKANIRNQVVTSQVMREEVGRRVNVTPGEAQRFYEAHKQDYAQPESVRLSEILVATDDDPAKLSTAKAKADDLEAKLKAGADFDKLARASSDGSTAAEGGDLGKFVRGGLAKVLEDDTFSLAPGGYTEPIRTKQGYVILKVTEHTHGGVPAYKDVEGQVQEAYYMSRMEPAMRDYLTTMRDESYLEIKSGYVDSGASPNKLVFPISYSSYTPPAPKKKKKAQRTRFRETEHGFRTKAPAVVPVSADTTPAKPASSTSKSKAKAAAPATMKAGKKEKIRYGQAPRETLPNTAETTKEDAGAVPAPVAADAAQAEAPALPAAPEKKTRYSARMTLPKAPKPKGPQLDTFAPAAPDAAEVADRQTQSAPLGLNGSTAKTKKKKKVESTATGEKTRMQERPKTVTDTSPLPMTPAAPVPGAPAPAKVPAVTSTPAAPPSSAPQQTPTSPDPPLATTPASEPPH